MHDALAERMKLLCNAGILLAIVARSENAGASARWGALGRNVVAHRQQQQEGTVNSDRLVRSTSIEGSRLREDIQPKRCRALTPLLKIRGGHGGADTDIGGTAAGIGDSNEFAGNGGAAQERGGDGGEGDIDEDLYSRQLYVMGKSAMAKMGKADVLISGMRSGSRTASSTDRSSCRCVERKIGRGHAHGLV